MSSYSGYVTVRINVKNVLIDAFLLLHKNLISNWYFIIAKFEYKKSFKFIKGSKYHVKKFQSSVPAELLNYFTK